MQVLSLFLKKLFQLLFIIHNSLQSKELLVNGLKYVQTHKYRKPKGKQFWLSIVVDSWLRLFHWIWTPCIICSGDSLILYYQVLSTIFFFNGSIVNGSGRKLPSMKEKKDKTSKNSKEESLKKMHAKLFDQNVIT